MFLQANSPGLDVITLSFPALKLVAVNKTKTNKLRLNAFSVVGQIINQYNFLDCTWYLLATNPNLWQIELKTSRVPLDVTFNCKDHTICFQKGVKTLHYLEDSLDPVTFLAIYFCPTPVFLLFF